MRQWHRKEKRKARVTRTTKIIIGSHRTTGITQLLILHISFLNLKKKMGLKKIGKKIFTQFFKRMLCWRLGKVRMHISRCTLRCTSRCTFRWILSNFETKIRAIFFKNTINNLWKVLLMIWLKVKHACCRHMFPKTDFTLWKTSGFHGNFLMFSVNHLNVLNYFGKTKIDEIHEWIIDFFT